MTATPTESNQTTYEPLPTADKRDCTESVFTEIMSVDGITLLADEDNLGPDETKHKLMTGSLSRSTASSWYFIAHGAADALLAVGPIFFFRKSSRNDLNHGSH
jgi:hypothetical protein